jgi:uncharacterized protein with GYD domain
MALYMIQAAYTAEAWSEFVKRPQNRAETVGKVIEKMGGKLIGFWYTFGEPDLVAIVEMPDNVTMAAFAMAVGAGGACSAFRTTVLLGAEDGMKAMKKAGKSGYKPVWKK